MQIKVTRTFAKYIDKFVKELGIAEEASLEHVGSMEYPGGTICNPDADLDYDLANDNWKVIKVFYPYEYYAPALCISTPMLNEEIRFRGGVSSEAELRDMLKDMIEV